MSGLPRNSSQWRLVLAALRAVALHATAPRPIAVAGLVGATALALGCSSETTKEKDTEEDVGVDDSFDTADDAATVDDAASDAASADVDSTVVETDTATADSTDTADDTDTQQVDTVVDVDAGPECSIDAQCVGKVTPLACQEARCIDGSCVAATAKGKCCNDKDCDDGTECTVDACDIGKQQCLHTAIPNCCSGKLTLLKAGFETGSGDLAIADGPTNGNVTWQPSTARARVGMSSLYLGNACGTYDTSMTPEGNCEAGNDAAPVTSTLTTKPILLPKDKSIQVQFWLWLDTEPSYADTLPKGSCSPACPLGSSCVSVNGSSQCLPEKDLLTVTILPDGGAPTKVFDSASINKTTGGMWRHIVLDLDSFQGKSVRVQWQFQTVTGFKNGFEGAYLDEITIETICAVTGTLCTGDSPCADDGNVCSDDSCTLYSNAVNKGVCFHDAQENCCLIDSNCDDGQPCTVDTCKAGVCQHNPDSSKPACCKPSVELSQDFDSGTLEGWALLDGNSGDVTWHIDPKAGTKASQALVFTNSAGTNYADPSLGKGVGPKGSACAPPVKLKVGSLYNLVTFQLQLETEWSYVDAKAYKNPPLVGQPKFDHFSVGVREEGVANAKIDQLWSSDLIKGTTDGKWIEVTVALDAYQGKTIAVCMTFDAGDDQVNDRAGVKIDELLVKVACSKPECLVNSQCDALVCAQCQAPVCDAGTCGCGKVEGCCLGNGDCDDNNPCTADVCNANQCQHTLLPGCCASDADCSTSSPCVASTCDTTKKQCVTAPVSGCCQKDEDCDKGLLCITATCDSASSKCVETPIAGCCKADAECDDKDPCTNDLCIDLKCQHEKAGGAGCGG